MSREATGPLADIAAGLGRRFAGLAEEMIESSRANRELMIKLVAGEVEKVANQFGLAREDEIDALRREVTDLRIALAHQTARLDELRAAARTTTVQKTAAKSPGTRATATRATAKKAPAKRATATKATAKKSASTRKGTTA